MSLIFYVIHKLFTGCDCPYTVLGDLRSYRECFVRQESQSVHTGIKNVMCYAGLGSTQTVLPVVIGLRGGLVDLV